MLSLQIYNNKEDKIHSMNIDLLFTQKGEAGLITSENLMQKAIGILFDTQSGVMSLEYADMDHLELNIPVEKEFFEVLDYCPHLHLGAVKDGHIAQAYQIPLMFLDDPYRGDGFSSVRQPDRPLQAFEYFVKRCITGQPVHREDLGAEDTMRCVLGDAVPSSLQFAPHLARRHAMEARPHAAPGLNVPGLNVPGLGLGSSGGRAAGGQTPAPPKSNPNKE